MWGVAVDTTGSADDIDAPRLRVRGWTLAAAALAAALAAGVTRGSVPPASAATVATLLPAALVDIRTHRLPDPLVALAAGVLITGLIVDGAAATAVDVAGPVAGAALFSGPLLALHLIRPASMGFGDVKVGLVLGAAIGIESWQLALPALAVAAALTAGAALALRAPAVPFGPGLVAGAAAALLAASVLVPAEGATVPTSAPPVGEHADPAGARA